MNVAEIERSMQRSGLLDQDDQRGRLWRLWGLVTALLAQLDETSAAFAAETRPVHIEHDVVFLPYPNDRVAMIVARSRARDDMQTVISDVMGRSMTVRTCVIGGQYTYP